MGRQSLLWESIDTAESINTFDFVTGLDMAVIDITAVKLREKTCPRHIPPTTSPRSLPVLPPAAATKADMARPSPTSETDVPRRSREEQENPRAIARSNRVGTVMFLAAGKE